MPLLINKDGKQLGPYSLEAARALVLSGTLDPTDWAWADGATDWLQLKDVPGFAMATGGKPGLPPPPATTTLAAATPTAEQELWRGHPSQLLNADVYIFWGTALLLTLIVVGYLMHRQMIDSSLWAIIIVGIVALIGLVNIAVAFFHLRSVEYVATNQRVRVISGLFSKDIQEIELFRVKDTMARQTFLLRLFGLGTITIISGDENHPRLVLSGVPGAIELREKIREEVMILRQRFGVREVDVM
jgi:membrane protein YdbS with pleckstrin-like domain